MTLLEPLVHTPTQAGIHRAEVRCALRDGHYELVLANGELIVAELAAALSLTVGVTALVSRDSSGKWCILGAFGQEQLRTRSGAEARTVRHGEGEHIEVRAADGTLVFSYDAETGEGTLAAPRGTMRVEAPDGDLELVARRSLKLRAPTVQLQARRGAFMVRDAEWQGERLNGAFTQMRLSCDRVYWTFGRLVERTKNVFRHVAGLHQLTAGRVRQFVEATFFLRSDRTDIKADADVRIDGNRINLG